MPRSARGGAGTWVGAALVGLLALTVLAPFLYMVVTSLMDEFGRLAWPPRLENYPAALTRLPFGRFFLNGAIVTGAVVAGQVLTSAMAAYALARLRFPGRDRAFSGLLAMLMVPPVVLLVPRFLLIEAVGWVDTYAGLISTELVSVWGIVLLRQFFLMLPRELEDAARLDGAGEWTVFVRVVLPQSTPALATLAVLAFVDQWKSFLWPLIVTRSLEMQVVELGLATFHDAYGANGPLQMAAAVAATLPLLVVFVFAQRYFIRGDRGDRRKMNRTCSN